MFENCILVWVKFRQTNCESPKRLSDGNHHLQPKEHIVHDSIHHCTLA